jgi:pantoate--beta-alanine ligase
VTPVVATGRAELAQALGGLAGAGGRTALVPTMGALHDGHAELLRAARRRAQALVLSIYVNPLQFGPREDLQRYPRDLAADLEVADGAGVDVVFTPSPDTLYPLGGPQVSVDPGPLGLRLEGVARPTHFRGVLTVVATLFGLVAPGLAFFGEKDYQQLVLVRRMVADLGMPVEVVAVPTVRADDGLALSSRNRLLDADQIARASALPVALRTGASMGARGKPAVLSAATAVLDAAVGVDVDYVELTDPELDEAPDHGPARLLVAARVDGVRLIDNVEVMVGASEDAA